MILEANLHWRYLDTESNLVMPWYTLPALEWLKLQPTKNWSVFEYGAGYSTIWWRLNCKEVISIDSNPFWAKAAGAKHVPQSDYITSCWIRIGYDCIIVDGDHRERCVEYCLPHILPGSYLIIDNYDSEDFNPESTRELLSTWQCEIYKQPNHSTWKTAVFKKPI